METAGSGDYERMDGDIVRVGSDRFFEFAPLHSGHFLELKFLSAYDHTFHYH